MSFQRDNLSYLVRMREIKWDILLETLKKVKGSGIVYVRSRKGTREIAAELKNNNFCRFLSRRIKHRLRSMKTG
jgi:ATP-dependent DNA helicase RecQ